MKNPAPDMKIRVSPAMRSMIEAARNLSGRTLNAEIVARLEWSFDKGYDAENETKAAERSALEKIQASPVIRLEKQIIAMDARLEGEIEAVQRRVEELEAKVTALIRTK